MISIQPGQNINAKRDAAMAALAGLGGGGGGGRARGGDEWAGNESGW